MVLGNNKLPRNTKMFPCPDLYISNTFLSILADPSSADFLLLPAVQTDVSTPKSFKLPFNRNGTVLKAPNTIGTTLVFTSHILLSSLVRFWYFSASFSFTPLSSGIATSIIWQLFLLLLTSTKSCLLASMWWSSVPVTNCPHSGFSFHSWVFSALLLTLKLVAVSWLPVTSSLIAFNRSSSLD